MIQCSDRCVGHSQRPPRVPIVQRPRTWPFQGQNTGSNPVGDATSTQVFLRTISAAVAAPVISYPSASPVRPFSHRSPSRQTGSIRLSTASSTVSMRTAIRLLHTAPPLFHPVEGNKSIALVEGQPTEHHRIDH